LPIKYFEIDPTSENSTTKEWALVIPHTVVKLSISQWIQKKKFVISRLNCYSPSIDPMFFKQFLKENAKRLAKFFSRLPNEEIFVMIKKARIRPVLKSEQLEPLEFDFNFKMKDHFFKTAGILSKTRQQKSNLKRYLPRSLQNKQLFHFHAKGKHLNPGLQFDELVIENENFFVKLWGDILNEMLHLNGFGFANTKSAQIGFEKSYLRYLPFIKNILRKDLTQKRFSKHSTHILDIDCRTKLDFEHLTIERFFFNLNNLPIKMKGDLFLKDPLTFDLEYAFFPARLGGKRPDNLKESTLVVSGLIKDKSFLGDADIHIVFESEKQANLPLEKIEAKVSNLKADFDIDRKINFSLDEAVVSFWSNGNRHRMNLADLEIFFNVFTERYHFAQFQAPFYDGYLNGKMWIDTVPIPAKMTTVISLNNIDANSLEELLIHFSKINGRLKSKIVLINEPSYALKGHLQIDHGQLINFEFFKWLAESFHLPSLEKIDFEKATADFGIDSENSGIRNIALKSNKVYLNGFFQIDRDNFVSSRLSLQFPNNVLRESPKFRPIIKIFSDNKDFLRFNFQLSGNQHAMNFQWLDNDVKKKIQARIPDFIERRIERSIDSSIEPPADQYLSDDFNVHPRP